MNRRRALSRKLTGVPRKRGSNALSELSGTNPREFSMRKGAREIEIAPMNLGARLARDKLGIDSVIAQSQMPPVGLAC